MVSGNCGGTDGRSAGVTPFYTKMMRWSKDPDQDYVVQWKESYCRCQLHPVCSENVVRGYILTLLDITQQKKETVLMEDLKKKAEEQSFLKNAVFWHRSVMICAVRCMRLSEVRTF